MVLTAGLASKLVLEELDGRDLISLCVYMNEYMCVLSRMVVRLSSRKIIESGSIGLPESFPLWG